eukprot:2132944-Rhodomonas_salina.1
MPAKHVMSSRIRMAECHKSSHLHAKATAHSTSLASQQRSGQTGGGVAVCAGAALRAGSMWHAQRSGEPVRV